MIAQNASVGGGLPNIMVGSPGSGESEIVKCIPTTIPLVALAKAIDTTRVHGICGVTADSTTSCELCSVKSIALAPSDKIS